MRLNKYIARSGFCSRRKAEEFIGSGRVYVNGKKASLTTPVEEGDQVTVAGKEIQARRSTTTYLFHKPRGIISTFSPKEIPNLADCIPEGLKLFAVGRLDKDSEGLLLLTSDGDLALKLTHPRYGHEKEYEVFVAEVFDEQVLTCLRNGVLLEDGRTQPCTVKKLGPKRFSIVLREGRNRQIRRMCETLGHQVQKLRRIRSGGLLLDIGVGAMRELTSEEIETHLKSEKSCQA
jgi:23S rRNA pseudouridine2604 synthase